MNKSARACVNHPKKYSQSKLWLCRECERAAGDLQDTIAREAETVARRKRQVHVRPPEFAGWRELVIAGIVYQVVWDGSMAGAAALGIPLARERGDPRWAPGPGRRALPAGRIQETSAGFARLACEVVNGTASSAERTAGLRKLLEAKDCIVRAALEG